MRRTRVELLAIEPERSTRSGDILSTGHGLLFMRRTSSNAAISANQVASEAGSPSPQNGATVATIKNLFPQHTRKALARLLGLSDGAARKKLTGERAFSASELAALLRSEHGLDFLAAIMAGASPRWWVQVQSAFKLGAMRRHRQQLQEAINEAERLGDTLARAETALGVCDADFHRPQVDALGTLRSDLCRPLARKR